MNQLQDTKESLSQTSNDKEECVEGSCEYQPKIINVIIKE